jgi:hypothetical protein
MVILCSFGNPEDDQLTGVWVRVTDHLRIQMRVDDESQKLQSFIIAEGDEKFPCSVNDLPIYKNVSKIGRNLWQCDFLVVTIGSCKTDYEEGIIQLTSEGKMMITCPGFAKKVYTRLRPRYET